MDELDTDIVMADLIDTADRLQRETASPVEVRRLFQEFVVLTQKLTSAMRKDHSRLVGGKFRAAEFDGWTPVTEFFKLLRNTDLHESPVTIEMEHVKYVPLPDVPGAPKLRLVLSYKQELPTQLIREVPETASVERANVDGSRSEVPFSDAKRAFVVRARTPELKKAIGALPTSDVHRLTEQCLATLGAFHRYFEIETSSTPSSGGI